MGNSGRAGACTRGRRDRSASLAHAVRLERVAAPAIVAAWVAPYSTVRTSGTRGSGTDGLMEAAAHPSSDKVAGFLCAFSLALSGVALVRTPGLLAPAAILVALVAVRMTVAHRTLAAVAVTVSCLAFFVGMVISITTDTSIY